MNLLLAVSGGIDSIYMAERSFNGDLFDFPYTWSIAHCNFSLRGCESDQDELFVRNWGETHNIHCFVKTFDTKAFAEKQKLSIEMAARELRYNWFYELCETYGFDAVCIAHNADDNVETLLLNMLRGCGSNGMKGMNKDSGYWPKRILRPLLGISREAIHSYMKSHNLAWREDKTNEEDLYKRNILRHKVLPIFREINPAFLDTLASDMNNIKEVHEIATDYYLENKSIIYNIDSLLKLKHWEYLIFREMEEKKFTSSTIKDVCTLIKSGRTRSGKTFFSDEYRLDFTSSSFEFNKRTTDHETTPEHVLVTQSGDYEIAGRRFHFSVITTPDNLKPQEGKLYVSITELSFPFTLRTWENGDFMQPLGMKGKKKLSNLFVDLKIPNHKKNQEVVLVQLNHDNNVLALLPYRISEHLRIDPKTETEVLMIEEIF